MGILRPADIARRVRDLADKRDKQAATTANPTVREQLIATAKNYRALAAELDRKVHSFDERVASVPPAARTA